MPRTVNQAFEEFIAKLTPTSSETSAATRHRASIQACLHSQFYALGVLPNRFIRKRDVCSLSQ